MRRRKPWLHRADPIVDGCTVTVCEWCNLRDPQHVLWFEHSPCPRGRKIETQLRRDPHDVQLACEWLDHMHRCTGHGHLHLCDRCYEVLNPNLRPLGIDRDGRRIHGYGVRRVRYIPMTPEQYDRLHGD